MTDTRQRILDTALASFAAKGYRATTITDIEEGAGLAVGSGATYRHFRSKQEILEAAIEALRERNVAFMAPVNPSMTGSGHDGIALGRQSADLLRLLFRDLAEFPHLQKRVIDHLITDVYAVAAERTAVISPTGDAEALAVVMSNAMLGFNVLESVLGVDPLGVDADRFAAAWGRLLDLVIADEFGADDSDDSDCEDP